MDLSDLTVVPILNGIGVVAVVLVVGWLVWTGRLVPKAYVDDIRADRNHWRQAWSLSEEARGQQREQVNALLTVTERSGEDSRLAVTLLRSIRGATKETGNHPEDQP